MTLAAVESNLPARMEYARAASQASLLPAAFVNQPANVLIAMEVADALGKRPFMVMQELAVISGKPSFSAKFMRALVREAGHRLRESVENGIARCVIVRHDDPDYEHVAVWDEKKARDHGYWGKGHWQKNPDLMLSNRALSECVRSACPEVLGGVSYTPDEVEDFAPGKTTVQQTPKVKPLTAAQIMTDSHPVESEPVVEEVDAETGEIPRDMITSAQTKKMGALMREAGLTGRDDALAFVTQEIGREVTSRAELTKEEASTVIDRLGELASASAPDEEPVDAEIVDEDGWPETTQPGGAA